MPKIVKAKGPQRVSATKSMQCTARVGSEHKALTSFRTVALTDEALPKRAIRTGKIKKVTVVPVDKKRSAFAIILELKTGKHIRILLIPPIIEAQFIYQLGKTVSLPVEKTGGPWRLRLDSEALKMMKKANVYDPTTPPLAFYVNRPTKNARKNSR